MNPSADSSKSTNYLEGSDITFEQEAMNISAASPLSTYSAGDEPSYVNRKPEVVTDQTDEGLSPKRIKMPWFWLEWETSNSGTVSQEWCTG